MEGPWPIVPQRPSGAGNDTLMIQLVPGGRGNRLVRRGQRPRDLRVQPGRRLGRDLLAAPACAAASGHATLQRSTRTSAFPARSAETEALGDGAHALYLSKGLAQVFAEDVMQLAAPAPLPPAHPPPGLVPTPWGQADPAAVLRGLPGGLPRPSGVPRLDARSLSRRGSAMTRTSARSGRCWPPSADTDVGFVAGEVHRLDRAAGRGALGPGPRHRRRPGRRGGGAHAVRRRGEHHPQRQHQQSARRGAVPQARIHPDRPRARYR